MNNKLSKIFLIPLFSISSSFAGDLQYSLEFSGDTISKSLIRNNYVESKNDTRAIKEILDYNNLNWSSARKLPVGFVYLIQNTDSQPPKALELSHSLNHSENHSQQDLKQMTSSNKSHSISVEAGTFHHTQELNQANIYSDLSQYVTVGYSLNNSYLLSADLKRYQYSADVNQNIDEGTTEYKYQFSALKTFRAGTFDFNIGGYTKSLLSFSVDSINAVNFEDANSSGVEARVQSRFYQKGDFSLFAGLEAQKNISAQSLEDYLSSSFQTGANFKYLERSVSLILRYGVSSINQNSEELNEEVASLGLRTLF
jgi:hypothetical protein